MKIMVLSVTAGDGHNAMGRAVIEEATKRGHEAVMVDYLKRSSPLRQFFSEKWYFWMLKHFPRLSHYTYEKVKHHDINKKPSPLCAYSFMKNSPRSMKDVRHAIAEYQPDMIYCTHIYTAALMSEWRTAGFVEVPTFYIVSDYVVHPYTEQARNIDYILTPSEDFNKLLFKMGYKPEQLLNFGITVSPRFSICHDKKEIRTKLGLNPDLPTVLIIGGATGFGRTDLLIKYLYEIKEKVQVIIVNGRNEALKEKVDNFIEKYNVTTFHNYGYVKNVDELMDASDLMVGKIGGVGVSEAFNKNLPIIVPAIPPFQEYDNCLYLSEKDCIMFAGDEASAKEVVERLINNPEGYSLMRENVTKIRKPNATVDFVDFMEELYRKKHQQ